MVIFGEKAWHCFLQGLWLRNGFLGRVDGEYWARIPRFLWQVRNMMIDIQRCWCSLPSPAVVQQTRNRDLSCRPAKTWLVNTGSQLRNWWVKYQHAGLLQEPRLLLPVRRRRRRRRRWWWAPKRWWWRRRRRRRKRRSFRRPWTLWTRPRGSIDWSPF